MASSGSIDFVSTKNEIIQDAMSVINAIGADETPSAEDSALCSRHLNRILKTLQAKGLNLFSKQEVVLFLSPTKQKYSLNSTSGDNAALVSDYVKTEIGADEALGQTVITVDSTAGMLASDKIGIEQDDDTMHWTTIVSVDDATTVTITSATTAAAASNNNVYTYTNLMARPLEVHQVRHFRDAGTEVELRKLSRKEYFRLSNKSSEGSTNSYYYDPQRGTGFLYVWPIDTSMGNVLKMTVTRTIEDMDNTNDNLDFPVEWEFAIVLSLAASIGSSFGRTIEAAQIKKEADIAIREVLMWDNEKRSIFLRPSK